MEYWGKHRRVGKNHMLNEPRNCVSRTESMKPLWFYIGFGKLRSLPATLEMRTEFSATVGCNFEPDRRLVTFSLWNIGKMMLIPMKPSLVMQHKR